MTIIHYVDIAVSAMLGGGIAMTGSILFAYLSAHKTKNSQLIVSQVMSVLTALAELIKNRENVGEESNDLIALCTGVRALIETFKQGNDEPSLKPRVDVVTSGLTTTTTVHNVSVSPVSDTETKPLSSTEKVT